MQKQTARIPPKLRKSRESDSSMETARQDSNSTKEKKSETQEVNNNNTKNLVEDDRLSLATAVTNVSSFSLNSTTGSLFERMNISTKEQMQREQREARIPNNRKLPDPIPDRSIAFYAGMTALGLLAVAFIVFAFVIITNL